VLTLHIIVASLAVGALSRKPRSTLTALAVAAAALVEVALGASAAPAIAVVAPLLGFLAAAMTLAGLVERSGLGERAASLIAAGSRGSALGLYALVCLLCALLTAIVSLDGAVVLMVPLLRSLARRFGAQFAPLFLGVVAVANAASIAVPQGNPTNLILMSRLGLSPQGFLGHMLVPGVTAAIVCAAVIALRERRTLAPAHAPAPLRWTPLSAEERRAALALAGAALAGWLAPLFGIAPWWPFSAAVALMLLVRRDRPRLLVPWRLGLQVAGLVVAIHAVALRLPPQPMPGAIGLVTVALAVGAASALINNLPASVSATTLLAAGPTAYAASIGLGVGALATPQGSVATLIATDLAGSDAPPLPIRYLAALACSGVLVATLLLRTTL
jgi:arsenical pump membrane protein